MKGDNQMTIQIIESQVLELLINLIKANEHALADEFIDELIKVVEQFIPSSNLCKLEKVDWVDIRNALETNISNAVLQAIVNLIASYTTKIAS
jgi:transposase